MINIFTYSIFLVDNLYRPLTTVVDQSQKIYKSHNNRLIEFNSGYHELQFEIQYYINGKENPLIDLLKIDSLLKYEDSNGVEEYFLIKNKTEIKNEQEFCIQYQCICEYVSRLSKLKTVSTIGGNDVEPKTISEWLADILSETGWEIGTVATLNETITIRDQDGNLQTITQEKHRALHITNSNAYSMIQELCNIFQAYPVFNNANKIVSIVENNSINRNVLVSFGKNVSGMSRVYNGDKIITKLYAYGGVSESQGLTTISSVNPTLEPYIINFQYYIDTNRFTSEHQILLDGYLTNLTNYNLAIKAALDAKSPLDAELIEVNAQIYTFGALIDQYNTDIAAKTEERKQYKVDSTEYNNLTAEIDALNILKIEKTTLYDNAVDRKTTIESEIVGYESTISSNLELKSAVYLAMNTELGMFISEGSFTDQNYMLPENLYSDALKISQRTSYPELTYNIDVMLLQGTEGFNLEVIRAGDQIMLEDEELNIYNLMLTITKIEYNLDNLLDSSIEISNVISTFEDIYSKIVKTNNIISAKSDIYNTVSDQFNGDGTIKPSTLEEALKNRTYNTWLNSAGTLDCTDEGLFIYAPILVNGEITRDTSVVSKLVSSGWLTKKETGWDYVIKTDGTINLSYATVGILDANKIIIRNGTDPVFSWNKNGIMAYDYDEYGIVSYEDYAKFYKNGLEVFQNNIRRVSAGKLPNDDGYGFAIYDNAGEYVVRTSDEGDLWLQKYISVGGSTPSENFAGISGVGSLDSDVRFWSGATFADREDAPFRVRHDGSLYANNAYLSGEIHASVGSIDQYLTVGLNPHQIVLDSGLDQYGELVRTTRLYSGGWALNGDGSASFNNVLVRGTIQASVFEYDQISAQAGSMMIMNATVLDQDFTVSSLVESVVINLKGSNTLLYGLFKINDILSIQVIDGNNLRKDYWFKVTDEKSIDGSGDIKVVPIAINSLEELPTDGIFTAGLMVINWKQGATSTGIRMVGASVGENAPFIDVFTASQNVDETYSIGVLPKVRMGLLDGIADPDFTDINGDPILIKGWGLYAENVFLKGSIVAENCRISNSTFTGNLYAGTILSGNVLIRDRAVEDDISQDGFWMSIYPDNEIDEPDYTKYRFLAYENGIHLRNYNMYFHNTDGLSTEIDDATGLISPSEDLLLFNRVSNYFINGNDYFTSSLYCNTLRFTNKSYASTPNILNYDLNTNPLFEVGATSSYGLIASQESIPVIFGVSKVVSNETQFDNTKFINVGVNKSPIHEFDLHGFFWIDNGIYFTDNDEDVIKCVKTEDGGSFYLDFFVL
jgi:hypothetical protein